MATPDNSLPPTQPVTSEANSDLDVERLAQLLLAHTPYDGRFELRIPGVYAIRVSRPTELLHTTHDPALCLVARGAKRMLLGQEVYDYDASRMLVVSVDLPVASQVIQASRAEPFLSFRLDLDPSRIAELVLKVFPHGVPHRQVGRGLYVGPPTAGIINAATRLMELMAHPGDAELIAPLVIDEILIRLLRGPVGSRVAQIGLAESTAQKIARAIAWVRSHYAEPMTVEALAELVHMSASSFHQHFKAVTAMSPVQYQKVLRLQEARRLMVTTLMDVGGAGRRVGYLSTSQFTREYSRYFGSAPTRDIARLREHDLAADVAHELVGDSAV